MKSSRPRLSIKRVEEALRLTGGIRIAAAHRLGVSRSTLYRFFDQHPKLMEFAIEVDEETKDLAESQVLKLLRSGDPQTVRWYLETKGKDRGYVRRVENTGPAGGPIETQQKLDLSKLTDEELEIMLRHAERRERDTRRLKVA